MGDAEVSSLLAAYDERVRTLAAALVERIRALQPDLEVEVDTSAGLVAFTRQPGTYRGLVVAVAPPRAWVNLMFAKGVELLPRDEDGLLEGTGKVARHIKVRTPEDVERPGLAALVEAAAELTPPDG